MKKFTRHTGVVAPINIDNVDTDQMIPSREMKHVSREGLGDGLFASWRYEYDGGQVVGDRPEFVLNRPEYAGASIILGGKNWGCGSSREHAVWALNDFGIRVVIAESFGRIFHGNCARNGLLAIELPERHIAVIEDLVQMSPQSNRILVDLEKSEIRTPTNDVFKFEVPAFDRRMLLNGLDFIEYTLQHNDAIEAFTESDRKTRPWAYLP